MALKMYMKIKRLADAILIGSYFLLYRLKHSQLEGAGAAFLVLLPILDVIKAASYYAKKPHTYKVDTLGFRIIKALASIVGTAAVLAGASIIGFAFITAAQAAVSLRSLAKSLHAFLILRDTPKGARHFDKFLISGANAAAFALVFVASTYIPLGWTLAMVSMGIGILSAFVAMKKPIHGEYSMQSEEIRVLQVTTGTTEASSIPLVQPDIKETITQIYRHEKLQVPANVLNLYAEKIQTNNTAAHPLVKLHHNKRCWRGGLSLFMLYNNAPSFPVKKLGEGVMGSVKKHALPNGEYMAVKRVSFESAVSQEDFEAEVACLKAIGRYKGHGTSRGKDYIKGYVATNYYNGPTLRRLLDASGVWNVETVTRIVAAMLAELKVVHSAGYVHSDIKPDNFIMEAGVDPKLIDFGFARKNNTRLNAGTPSYTAPEGGYRMAGMGPIYESVPHTFQMDIYSLGLTFSEIFNKIPRNAGPQVVHVLRQMAASMQRHKPSDRPTLDNLIEQVNLLIPAQAKLTIAV